MIVKKLISIILICQLLVLSFACSAFAEESTSENNSVDVVSDIDTNTEKNMNPDSCDANEGKDTIAENPQEEKNTTDDALPGQSADNTTESEQVKQDAYNSSIEEEESAQGKVEKVKAYAGYKAVLLKWNKVEGASEYRIYRKLSTADSYKMICSIQADDSEIYTYRDSGIKKDSKYKYYLTSVIEGEESAPSEKVTGSMVRTIHYKLTVKSTFTLSSVSNSDTKTFKTGDVIIAEGFKRGNYIARIDGSSYKVQWYRIKKPKVDYKKNAYGTSVNNVTADDYINHAKFSSKTKYLIWISLYTQRIFVFKGKTGKWECIRSWQCNSGRASTPTESGTDRKIYAKYAKNSKHKYWSRFSRLSSIHGRNSWDAKLGKPISGGCVRIDNSNARFVMNNIPYKTRVVVF